MSVGDVDGGRVERSGFGDEAAYADLVREHYPCVYALCLGMVFNREDARDLAQETVLTGFRKIGSLAAGERFRPWILRIARNLCIDAIRRRQSERQRLKRLGGRGEKAPAGQADVAWAIETLPAELRAPIVMFYFDGRRAEAIAEALDISRSHVYERLQEARMRLHELLREDY